MPGTGVPHRGITREYGGITHGDNGKDKTETNNAASGIPVGNVVCIRLGHHGEDHLKYGHGQKCGYVSTTGNFHRKGTVTSVREMAPGRVYTTGSERDVGVT